MNAPFVVQTNESLGKRGEIHIYNSADGKTRPFILGIHGGGWERGDQTAYAFLWPKIESLGYALVLTSYRVAPQFRFPCAYEDSVQALSWLKENGNRYGLDVGRCLLFGGSAGGHLAMLLATRATKEKRIMPQIRGVINYCGIMDLASQYLHDQQRKSPMTGNFMGSTPQEQPEAYYQASPIHHLHRDMPPLWIAHGTSDTVVDVSQSRELVRLARQDGYDPVYLEARDLPHTLLECGADGRANDPLSLLFEADALRFIRKHLGEGLRG